MHNLQNISVAIPLHKIVGIAGVSGSGKSSLAIGIVYAEGSRRYLEALSTYTRRRLTQAQRPDVDEVLYVPPALALHQRPGIPDIRSTFGTATELLNVLRLIFSRLASHRCPNGHYLDPTLDVAAEKELVCPVCSANFYAPSAEELSFNSQGACPKCQGTGLIRTVDESTLVPDESLSIDQGAVAPWNSLMWSLMKDVCREMGVRTNIPFKELNDKERDIVFHGPAEKKHLLYKAKNSNTASELDFTYYNAVYTVENALAKIHDEKGLKRVEKFLRQEKCPACNGSRLSEAARAPLIQKLNLAQATSMALSDLENWILTIPGLLPAAMRPMAQEICDSFARIARRLKDLGLDYLQLDRAASTLSNGERQRMQLARAVRNRTTGALYVLDEPSIGLHPHNLGGIYGIMQDLVADGNSIILVDHDTQLISKADWIIELGPGAGAKGGKIIAEGCPSTLANQAGSLIGPFLKQLPKRIRADLPDTELYKNGTIELVTREIHTVKPLSVKLPKGALTVVTGVSGSGKTTLILESLLPALEAMLGGKKLPEHIKSIKGDGIKRIRLIDSSPIGTNIRSTVATYANLHDEWRRLFAKSGEARKLGLKAGDFSYNTGNLRCPVCDGTGIISLDIQFLPDVDIPCPECAGSRYSRKAFAVKLKAANGSDISLPELMAMNISECLLYCEHWKSIKSHLKTLAELGLGYLTPGEATPALSGGEAQRLKLASEMGRTQEDSIFIFDEPTIGLHPLDVKVLLNIFETMLAKGATIIVIEHDLDIIKNADYIVDMGPGGGNSGGKIVAQGPPAAIIQSAKSLTGKYLGD